MNNDNIKFVIFLSEKDMKKKMFLCGKKYTERLRNKGIFAIDYYQWRDYFVNNNILVPTFDINETAPTMGVIYKKFTDNKYLSLDNYDNYLFREQCRALSTLVSYLGAESIKVEQKIIKNNQKNVDTKLDVMGEAEAKASYEKDSKANKEILGIKEFGELVESYIGLGGKKFDKCASEGALYGVDKNIYKRLYFVNIVSERFNGQNTSFFTIHKKTNTKEIVDIGTYVKKLKIGMNFDLSNINDTEESYTFIIKYYDLETILSKVKARTDLQKQEKKEKKKTKLLKRAQRQEKNVDISDSDSDDEFDLELQEVLLKQKTLKNEKEFKLSMKNLINKYAEFMGVKKQFDIWKSKSKNTCVYNSRCKWIKCVCDIDNFFKSIGIL